MIDRQGAKDAKMKLIQVHDDSWINPEHIVRVDYKRFREEDGYEVGKQNLQLYFSDGKTQYVGPGYILSVLKILGIERGG